MSEVITISYGVDNTVTKPEANYPNVQSVLDDENLKQFLGFRDSVTVLVNGGVVEPHAALYGGDEVVIEPKANSKG